MTSKLILLEVAPARGAFGIPGAMEAHAAPGEAHLEAPDRAQAILGALRDAALLARCRAVPARTASWEASASPTASLAHR